MVFQPYALRRASLAFHLFRDRLSRKHPRVRQHIQSAGLYLAEAKRQVARRADMTWPQFLKLHCAIGTRRADEIIAIADGRDSQQSLNDRKNARRWPAAAERVRAQSPQITQQKQLPTAPTDPLRAAVMARISEKLERLTDDSGRS